MLKKVTTLCRNVSAICPEIDTVYLAFLKIFKSEFLIQALISQLIVNKNVISIYQYLSLGVDKQKQTKN